MTSPSNYFDYQQTRPHQLRGRIMADMIHRRIEATAWDYIVSNNDRASNGIQVADIGYGNGWLCHQYGNRRYENVSRVRVSAVDTTFPGGYTPVEPTDSLIVSPEWGTVRQLLEDKSPSYKGFYDGVVLGEVLEHVDTPFVMLAEVYELLRPGGWVVGSAPNSGQLWDVLKMLVGHAPHQVEAKAREPHYEHQSFFTIGLLRSLLRDTGFTRVKIYTNMVRLLPRGRETQIPLLSPFVERVMPRFGDRLIWEGEKPL